MRYTLIVVTLLGLLLPLRAEAQFDLESYNRARALLGRAAAALGGYAVREFESLRFDFEARERRRGQSGTPFGEYDEVSSRGEALFLADGSLHFEYSTQFRGGIPFSYRRALTSEQAWNLRPYHNELTAIDDFGRQFLRRTAVLNPPRVFPHSLVRAARQNLSSLRYVEPRGISFASDEYGVVTLYLGSDTDRPARAVALGSDPLLGDVEYSIEYGDYRQIEGLAVPFDIRFRTGDEQLIRWSLEHAAVNSEVDPARFEPPTDIEFTEPLPQWRPIPVAEGVWLVRLYSSFGLAYNTMLVERSDHLVAFEAPLSDLFLNVVRGVGNAVAPGKPVRYVVTTHHHVDHILGIRAYLASGATVVATPMGAALIDSMIAVGGTLQQGPRVSAESVDVITFSDSLVLPDPLQEIRIYNVGPSPHAEQIGIAYLPGKQLVFTSDLYAVPEHGEPVAANPVNVDFARRLEELGLAAELIVAGHGPPTDREALEKSLALEAQR